MLFHWGLHIFVRPSSSIFGSLCRMGIMLFHWGLLILSLFNLHQAFWGAFVKWALCSFIRGLDCTSLFILHQAFSGAFGSLGWMGLPLTLCNTHPWAWGVPDRTNERTGPRASSGLGGPEFRGITPGPRVSLTTPTVLFPTCPCQQYPVAGQ